MSHLAVDARLGHARHVLDRFHVIRWFQAGLTAVRRDVQRRQLEGVKPAFEPEVFRTRFALLRRGDTLTDTDRDRLDTLTDTDRDRLESLFDAHPRLRSGWKALQELHGLYTTGDHQGALNALGRFCDLYTTAELPEFHDIVDTFTAWSHEILTRHHAGRPSNGRIKGTNNLPQVLRHTAHSFTNTANFEARSLLITRPAHRCQQLLIPQNRAAPTRGPQGTGA